MRYLTRLAFLAAMLTVCMTECPAQSVKKEEEGRESRTGKKPAAGTKESAILAVSGAVSLEELDESEFECLEALLNRPLYINTVSISRLRTCGLFNPFQAASVDEWRRNGGDILSVMELGMLEGFTPESARRIAPFISFASSASIGRSSLENSTVHEFQSGSGIKSEDGSDTVHSWKMKYRFTRGEKFSFAVATRQEAATREMTPDTWSANVCIYGQRRLGKLILGDFNARFGQGLTMWSGFSLSGAGTVASMVHKPTGISPAWTYSTSCHRGIAADFILGAVTVSGMISLPELRKTMDMALTGKRAGDGKGQTTMPAMNIAWLGRSGTASATVYRSGEGKMTAGADMRWSFGTVDVFGETAIDLRSCAVGALGGMLWTPVWQKKIAFTAHWYPQSFDGGQAGPLRSGSKARDECGITAGVSWKGLELTSDWAHFFSKGYGQFKTVGSWNAALSENLTLISRASLRIRQQDKRTDIRADCRWSSGAFNANARINWLHCRQNAWLSYVEGGYKRERFNAWARATTFLVKTWEDRIYVYERDAPGNFNVPAYYGNGLSVSTVCGWKAGKSNLYLRAALTKYKSDRPTRMECRLQYTLSL